MMAEQIEKLIGEIERRFSSPWGHFNSSIENGILRTGEFVKRGDGIMIDPKRWGKFKEKWLKRSKGEQ